MKRNLIKVFVVLFLVIVLINNVCYADLIDPERPYTPVRPPVIIDDPIPDPPVAKISFWTRLLNDFQYILIGGVVLLAVFGAIMVLANNEEQEIEAAKGREEVIEEKVTKKRTTKKAKKEEPKQVEEETKEEAQDTDNTEEK